jgi:hypothetical protein
MLVDTLSTYNKARELDEENVPFNIINNNTFR